MTNHPEWGTPEWHRKHPIYKTDFSKPPSAIVERIRSDLAHLRGQLHDVRFGYPRYIERLETAQRVMTCCIAYLYDVMKDMEKIEQQFAEEKKNAREGLGTDE